MMALAICIVYFFFLILECAKKHSKAKRGIEQEAISWIDILGKKSS
jgi:hypothetical protein